MAEPKTKPTKKSVHDFLGTIEPEQKRKDSFALLALFEKVTGEKPAMWGSSIVGFGTYHSNTGEWPRSAFSPRKQNLTLYIMPSILPYNSIWEKLGKYKTSKACLYINRLSDVDQTLLATIIKISFAYMEKQYPSAK